MQKSCQIWVFVEVDSFALAFYATFMQILNWKFDLFHYRWVVLLLVYIACALSGVAKIVFGIKKSGHALISFLELDRLSGRTWKISGFLVFVGGIFAYFLIRGGLLREFLPDLALAPVDRHCYCGPPHDANLIQAGR